MDYTSKLQHDLDCNYLDLSKDNASNIILGCINKPQTQQINNNKNVVEGFAADYSSGVRYIPKGTCPDGYKNKGDGCYQVCKSCNYSEKLIEKVLYSEESKELLNEDAFNYAVTDVDWDLNQNGEPIE